MEEKRIAEEIYQIFDKVFKKVLTLSARAVINLINGLFNTNYPLDSTITYNWTEFEDDNLKRILADTIITINGKWSYHLEAQMENDNSIVFRVFDYGYAHAGRTRIVDGNHYVLRFPKPIVIYLYYEREIPDEHVLTLEFDEGAESYEYRIPVLKLPEISAKELNDRNMVILIPFHVLKLRYALKNGMFAELEDLQRVILNDIIGYIDENLQLENITMEDAMKLKRYLEKLCDYLYVHHKELEVLKDMTDESFMTDIDFLCEEHERELKEKLEKIRQIKMEMDKKDKLLEENKEAMLEKDKLLEENKEAMLEKDKLLEEKEDTISKLLERIKTLEES